MNCVLSLFIYFTALKMYLLHVALQFQFNANVYSENQYSDL